MSKRTLTQLAAGLSIAALFACNVPSRSERQHRAAEAGHRAADQLAQAHGTGSPSTHDAPKALPGRAKLNEAYSDTLVEEKESEFSETEVLAAQEQNRPATHNRSQASLHSSHTSNLPPSKAKSTGIPEYIAKKDEVKKVAEPSQPSAEVCGSVEYPGEGPTEGQTSASEWFTMVSLFEQIKVDVLEWLYKNQKRFDGKTFAIMENRIKAIRIQRPPNVEEPDLSWRGIGVWSYDSSSAPVLRLGGGFFKLLTKHPDRAKFEMARLFAQAWAPCDLQKQAAGNPWNGYLRCMGIEESQGCSNGSYSEAAWAVSSAVAQAIAAPGCRLPAFTDPASQECSEKMLLPLILTASVQR